MDSFINTTIQYCNDVAERRGNYLRQHFRGSCELSVQVKTGLHAGRSSVLESKEFTIGDSVDDDIMLLGDIETSSSIVVTQLQTFLGPIVSIKTSREDVTVNNGKYEVGKPLYKLPCTIAIDETRIELKLIKETEGDAAYSSGKNKFIIGLALLLTISLILNSMITQKSIDGTLSLSDANQLENSRVSADAANTAVSQMIEASNLRQYLVFDTSIPGAIRVTGTLPSQRMPEWHTFREKLNSDFHLLTTVIDVAVAPQINNLPGVAFASLGEIPILSLTNGSVVSIGEKIVEDWIVESIDETGFRLKRNGDEVFVAY